ncbi:hypothetical protein BHYA_0032g00060 [Botrytis hyacinthi]|uniref:Potassium channel tetramerisation-type BTB domain-containing protein n=1 Tax=Botrytis hyacinthi TaxID=278943 RepID=A0A4Z1H6G2_9HELO|nr:hypothetical protein BHYA_0032g00060 [Botrytis hyacinthi]
MSATVNSNLRTKHRIAPAAGGPITIQVEERRFITTKNTMTEESPFFAAPISGRWDSNKQADGSYFIDADPDLFEHILRLRVRVHCSVEELDDFWSETQWTDENVVYHPRWDTEEVYICPREIDVHRGNESACGRQCENVRGDSGYKYEDEPILKTLVIRKKFVVDQEACLEGLDEN